MTAAHCQSLFMVNDQNQLSQTVMEGRGPRQQAINQPPILREHREIWEPCQLDLSYRHLFLCPLTCVRSPAYKVGPACLPVSAAGH